LIVKVTKRYKDWSWLVKLLVDRLPPDEGLTAYPSLHEISGQFTSVDWLWPAWIPRGMLTLFGAAPGAGKSLVALDLARRVIHGEPFPDGAPSVDGGPNPYFPTFPIPHSPTQSRAPDYCLPGRDVL
jgi:hypothetical protein